MREQGSPKEERSTRKGTGEWRKGENINKEREKEKKFIKEIEGDIPI